MYEKNISRRWKSLTYLKYIEIISSKVFKSSFYVITYLPGMFCDSWNATFRFIMWTIRNDKFAILRMRTEEIEDVLSYGDFLYLWFLYERIFFLDKPCIQGLNIPKAFDHPTHKKSCFLCSLIWPSFKCLKIAANHTQLSTCSTVFFCPTIFSDTIFDPSITSDKEKKSQHWYKHCVLQGWPKGTVMKAYLSSFRHETWWFGGAEPQFGIVFLIIKPKAGLVLVLDLDW